MSAGSVSETATSVRVPGTTMGFLVAGAPPAGGVALGVCGGDVGPCFSGSRRFNNGRGASSGALVGVLSVGAGAVIDVAGGLGGAGGALPSPLRCMVGLSSAGEAEGAGDAPLSLPRWSIGRSSEVTGGGAAGFFTASAGCHLARAVQPWMFVLLRMVA